jgi:hypothetical protein
MVLVPTSKIGNSSIFGGPKNGGQVSRPWKLGDAKFSVFTTDGHPR